MQILNLPYQLLKFWYLDSLFFFLRVWKNGLLYLEEDLAVGLMLKLLFVPLFHDTTISGRVFSFFFRLTRVIIGLFAFFAATVFILFLALSWFLTPLFIILLKNPFNYFFFGLIFSGVFLFIYHKLSHPVKKVWQLKKDKGNIPSIEKIWQCSFLKKEQLSFLNLLRMSGVKNLLLYLEQDPKNFLNFPFKDPDKIVSKAYQIGANLGVAYLKEEHFFVAAIEEIPGIESELIKTGLTLKDLRLGLEFLQKREKLWKIVWIFDEDFSVKHLKGTNRGWFGVPTPTLDAISLDLTKKGTKENLVDFVGRVEIVNRVIDILSLEKGRNVILVGEPGSGKSTLVEYLVKIILRGDAPPSFATKRIVKIDLTRLLAGIKEQGELAERIKQSFEEAERSGNIIIFIDEIENLGIGEASTNFNLYSLLLPFIESDQFQFITTADQVSYTKTLEKNGSLAHLFTKIDLPEASPVDTLNILEEREILEERYHKVKFSVKALQEIVEKTVEYIHDRVLPDAALQVYEECAIKAENGWVLKKVVEEIIQVRVKVPIGELKQEQKSELLNLETLIHKKMIDQEEAVSAVSNTLRRAAVKLRDTNRPIGSFLFVGPTGVGKTELSKILAEVYFKGQGKFVRFDMSEYQTVNAAEKLIGGISETGELTESIRLNPYSLILLDEFEKADPKVLTLFLQVLEDGRLTDGAGRTVDFKNTIIIATSNAGSLTISSGLTKGQSIESLKTQVQEELLQIFKPELINRFDDVVLFKSLSKEDLQKIVQLKLAGLDQQLEKQGYKVEFTSSLILKLVERGFDPSLGARPLRRLIQDTLEARLSTLILEGKLPKGQKFLAGEELLAP